MILLVDSKEPDTILAQVRAVYPADAKSKNLGTHSGDLYAQLENGVMIVERKTPEDLCASIADGRLFAQCENIAALARFAFLVVDGKLYYQDGKLMRSGFGGFGQSGWTQVAIESALLKCEMLGVIVVRAMGNDNYADTIRRLIALCEKSDAPHRTRGKTRSRNAFDETKQAKLDFIASLPGIGTERAANLLERFPDEPLVGLLEWMCNQSALTQEKIPLWGDVTRQTVREFLGLRASQKLKIESRAEWKEVV